VRYGEGTAELYVYAAGGLLTILACVVAWLLIQRHLMRWAERMERLDDVDLSAELREQERDEREWE